jgi:hypothetical protein
MVEVGFLSLYGSSSPSCSCSCGESAESPSISLPSSASSSDGIACLRSANKSLRSSRCRILQEHIGAHQQGNMRTGKKGAGRHTCRNMQSSARPRPWFRPLPRCCSAELTIAGSRDPLRWALCLAVLVSWWPWVGGLTPMACLVLESAERHVVRCPQLR